VCDFEKKYICQKGKLFYILRVRILYGLFGKDHKRVITAYNFMIFARFSPQIKLFVVDIIGNLNCFLSCCTATETAFTVHVE